MTADDNGLTWDLFAVAVSDGLVAVGAEVPAEGLGPQLHLVDDLGLDSFGVFAFAGELEVRLGRPVPPSDAEPTLANVYRLVGGGAIGGDGRG